MAWDCSLKGKSVAAGKLSELGTRLEGKIWFVDETYLRVSGGWCDLYRGIDENGDLVDVRLSEKRDMEAAKAFFAQADKVAQPPQRVAKEREDISMKKRRDLYTQF